MIKLTIILSIAACLHVSAKGFSQTVSLSEQNASLEKVFQKIKKQTGYTFAYTKTLLQRSVPVNVNVTNASIHDALRLCLANQPFDYTIVNKTVVLMNRKESERSDLPPLPPPVTINGKVLNEKGEPLSGATVTEKGTVNATVTKEDGTFTISVKNDKAIVVVSFIGYASKEMSVSGKENNLVFELQVSAQSAESIIIIGYGSQRKATVTGSVASVSGAEITKSPSPNVVSNLAGRLPGLIVNQRTGEPGRDDPNILIRGSGTFRDNSPLIIIDGVQRSLIGRLNPEDIESISVLKDASAAIYGARAANGVILVTTKKGAKGKPSFDFSYNYAFQRPTKIPDVLDAAAFAEVFNEADWYRKGRPTTNYTPFYTDAAIQKYRDGSDPVLYPNTDWVGEVLKDHSYQQRLNLQVSGGSDAVRYLLSFGTTDQDGMFRYDPTHYRQYNIRTKVDVELNKNLTLGANIYAILNNRRYPSTGTDVNLVNILQANPTIVARYPNGLIGPGRLGENPMLIDQRGSSTLEDFPVYSTFSATYKIPWVQGLKLDATYNYDISNQFEKNWSIPYFFYEYNVNTKQYDKKQGTGTAAASLTDTYRKWTTMLYNFRMTYDKTIGQHHVTAMIGNEQQKNTFRFASAFRKNYVSSVIDQINVGSTAPADKDNSGSASSDAYNNYFGRLNYDFNSKYLFEFLFRYDGSQIFPDGKRYGFFPGVSAGWRLSEEEFIQSALPFVDQLKLRASYGEIGNNRVNQWQYLQSFSFGDNYVFGTNDVPGILPNTIPNPNITWETAKKTDVGLEASLWKGLLGMEFTYWTQKRSDILAARSLSVSNIFGFPGLPDENIGKVNSHGFELQLTHRSSAGKLNYNLAGNVAFAKSKIVFMDETPLPEPYQNQTGHPVGSALYYKADGIFHTQEELDKYPHGDGAQVGDIKVVDLNGDNKIDSKDQFRFDYSATPQYTFGLNADLQYGSFDLNLFFQGQTRAYKYDATASVLGGTDFANAYVSRAEDRWTVSNTNGSKPRADMWQPGNTTFFLYDATFVRMKTVELGYSLPQRITSRIKFNNVRVYVSAFNLLTWAKEIKWADPEVNGTINIDNNANMPAPYPPQRVINLGVNVKF